MEIQPDQAENSYNELFESRQINAPDTIESDYSSKKKILLVKLLHGDKAASAPNDFIARLD